MQADGVGVKEELADDGVSEVAVGAFAEQRVAEFGLVAEIGESILVAALAFDSAGEGQPSAGLANLVESDVGQGDVLFEGWAVACPQAELLAEDEGVVAEAEEVIESRVHRVTCA